MNIYNIKEETQALEQIGIAIDTPERLELALIKLSELANADQLLFWGKITTTSSPYYIAQAIDFDKHYSFPHKKFYYSKDNFVFNELPSLDEFNRAHTNNFNTLPFTGNPQTILINVQAEGEQSKIQKKEDEDSQEEQAIKILPKNYTQQDRLSYTVHAIEEECQVVPVGSFRMITSHEIRYNQQFKGVKLSQFSLSSFNFFRYPHQENAKQKIQSAQSIFTFDLFDQIENQHFWSAQINTNQTIGTLRSLQWPGYIGYAFLKKPIFGGVYYGNGLKQVEIAFYI